MDRAAVGERQEDHPLSKLKWFDVMIGGFHRWTRPYNPGQIPICLHDQNIEVRD